MENIFGEWSRLVCVIVTLLVMSPFLVALMVPINARKANAYEEREGRVPRLVVTLVRIIISVAFVVRAMTLYYSAKAGVLVAVAVLLLVVLVFSKKVRESMARIENKFLDNLNERELRRSGKKNAVVHDLHKAYITVGTGCSFVGQRLMDSDVRRSFGVNIVGIQRGTQYIPIPDGRTRIFPGDVISVIGTDDEIERMLPDVEKISPNLTLLSTRLK